VDAILPEILASLQHTPNLVVEAPPGAGKTTRVPPAILGLVSGEVIVLEPRRIAARLAARRVAWELGEKVGGTVGYQVRFEERIGPRTRLRFVTEGTLQTTNAIAAVKKVVEHAGFKMSDLVAVTVYVTDLNDVKKMNDVYIKLMPDPKPTPGHGPGRRPDWRRKNRNVRHRRQALTGHSPTQQRSLSF
jgi:hypothetical protein